jgi:excisionase family DNA binding protein
MEFSRLTYSVEETARILGLGRTATYQGIKSKEIPSIRIGKRILIPRAALEHLLKNNIALEKDFPKPGDNR